MSPPPRWARASACCHPHARLTLPELSRLRGRKKEEGEAMPPPRQGGDSGSRVRGGGLCLCGKDRSPSRPPLPGFQIRAPRVCGGWRSDLGVPCWQFGPLIPGTDCGLGHSSWASARHFFTIQAQRAPWPSPHPGGRPLVIQPPWPGLSCGPALSPFGALPGRLPSSLPPSRAQAAAAQTKKTLPTLPSPPGPSAGDGHCVSPEARGGGLPGLEAI